MSLSRLLSRTTTLSRSAWSSRLLPVRPALRAPYSAAAGLSRDTIQTRILDVLRGYEKIDAAKVVSFFKPHSFLTIFLADPYVIFFGRPWFGQLRYGWSSPGCGRGTWCIVFNVSLQQPLPVGLYHRYSGRRGRWDSNSWPGCVSFPCHLEYSVTVSLAVDYIAKTPEGLLPFLNLFCFWLMESSFLFSAKWLKAGTERRGNIHTVYRSHPFLFSLLKGIPNVK